LDKVKAWHFHSFSNEVIWPKKILNYIQGLKSAILAIFETGLEWPLGRVLLVWSLTIPHRISRILFVLCSYEFLAMLEGTNLEQALFLGFNIVK
jgi:hypothetical protein